MNAFLAAIVAAVIIAVGAVYVLGAYQQQADQAFQTSAVRVPVHGEYIANLVGKDWAEVRQ